MSINPKSMISAISLVQKSEIECKTMKLKTSDSSYKIDLRQTQWWAKIRRRLKLFTLILRQRQQRKIQSSAKITALGLVITKYVRQKYTQKLW